MQVEIIVRCSDTGRSSWSAGTNFITGEMDISTRDSAGDFNVAFTN